MQIQENEQEITIAGGLTVRPVDAFAAWFEDQQTNENAPDRFRFDAEFMKILPEIMPKYQTGERAGKAWNESEGHKHGHSIDACLCVNYLFWGFLGAIDFLSAKQ
ncbi:MAG: hypothetical protein IKF90_07250 [Parasporobacterium sp.]|nr:hypothetical protein [Parasporobacterium sp.]